MKDNVINGTKIVVPDGDVADFAVVTAKEGSDIGVYIVDLKSNVELSAKNVSRKEEGECISGIFRQKNLNLSKS